MKKILTIIIPTYNMEKYLRRCLDSLIMDDSDLMNSLEVLVINDGSKDTSSAIAHEYEQRFPNTFHTIDKENGNYGSCINRGLNEMTGKYVKVLDADDYFEKNGLSKYFEYLQTADADMILTDYDIVNVDNKIVGHVSYPLNSKETLKFKDVSNKEWMLNIAMHGITYKTDIFLRINYVQSEGISYTDQEWIFTPMFMVNTCSYFPSTLYKYLVGRIGQTMDPEMLVKNISHTIKGIYKMCADCLAYEMMNNQEHSVYVNYQLKKRCKYIYRSYLITYPCLPLEELIEFDDKLRCSAPQIYNMLENVVLSSVFPVHFVRKWRKSGFKKNIFTLKVCRIANRLSYLLKKC